MCNNNNKKIPWVRCILSMVGLMLYASAFSINSNYQFINNKTQTSFHFKLVNNLIVIPVQVNDMQLNLILDTGMRSVVLFGKRFERKLNTMEDFTVRLSGYGRRKNRPGKLSIGNKIEIEDVLGSNVAIVIMPSPDLFRNAGMLHVDGIIGYELFSRFTVKIDYPGQTITLYEPYEWLDLSTFQALPLFIKDTKPYISASLLLQDGAMHTGYYHLDTGSALDMLLFLNDDQKQRFASLTHTYVGTGIGGKIVGYKGRKAKVMLAPGVERQVKPTYIKRNFSSRELQNAAGSIGSGLLKEMVVVLDYVHMKFYIESSATRRNSYSYPWLVLTDN